MLTVCVFTDIHVKFWFKKYDCRKLYCSLLFPVQVDGKWALWFTLLSLHRFFLSFITKGGTFWTTEYPQLILMGVTLHIWASFNSGILSRNSSTADLSLSNLSLLKLIPFFVGIGSFASSLWCPLLENRELGKHRHLHQYATSSLLPDSYGSVDIPLFHPGDIQIVANEVREKLPLSLWESEAHWIQKSDECVSWYLLGKGRLWERVYWSCLNWSCILVLVTAEVEQVGYWIQRFSAFSQPC